MAFVYETVTEDDLMFISSMHLMNRFGKHLSLSFGMKWCSDRENNAFLIDIDGGFCFSPTYFVFLLNKRIIRTDATLKGANYDANCNLKWEINKIYLPEDMADEKDNIINLIVSAFRVNRSICAQKYVKSIVVKINKSDAVEILSETDNA